MEQNKPLISKKIRSLMHVMFFMLKKGISKPKIFAGKSLNNLLFHRHRHPHRLPPSAEYECSCSDTPLSCRHMVPSDDNNNNNNNNIYLNIRVMKALEDMLTSATSSPGYVKSPVVRQLRITDSPFPLTNGDEDGQVDEDADKFIMRFYDDLRLENK